jgi:hypothetical protein
MAGNTSPIYSRVGDIGGFITALTANTTTDLTAGTIYLAYTADATNGSRVERMRFMPLGTNVATAVRIWVNNGGATGTAGNNAQIQDFTAPATTVSQVAGIGVIEIPLNLVLPPAYTLYVTVGTTIAAGLRISTIAGKY